MGRRSGWVVVGAGLAVLVLVAVLAVARPWSADGDPAAEPTPTPEPPPAAVLATADGQAPLPTAEGVHAAIDALVRSESLGGPVSAAVVDVASRERLYQHAGAEPVVPASTIKLVTAATVLAARGPAHQLATVVLAGAEPGEVVLVGGGDPTLAVAGDGFYPGAGRLDQLAEQVREALGEIEVESVTVDADLFTGPVHGRWDDDIPDSGFVGPITALMTDGGRTDPDPAQGGRASQRHRDPDLAAGAAFADLLGVDPDQVSRGAAPPTAPPAGATPAPGPTASPPPAAPADPTAPGTVLGRVHSPPMLRLVELMLADSDNVLAEALARQVALARDEPASFKGAAAAMEAVLTELGVELGDAQIADGSGLSRANRMSADLLTELLALAAAAPDGAADGPALTGMFAGLPVAGWSGTLVDRYRPSDGDEPVVGPGAGMVRAKTGSLNGVHGLAGLVVTADGRLLAFAVLANEVPVDPTSARQALDEVATELAGCGCR